MTVADVVVVGGGPAGAAAAIGCASAGLGVVLVEAADSVGQGPGETLHPGVEPLLDRLGVGDALASANLLRHQGQWVAWGAPARFEAFGADAARPWRGYQAPRRILDELLLVRAEAAGARVWRRCRALTPVVERGRVAGVRTPRGEVLAATVIDASGRRHWLTRHLGHRPRRVSPRLIVAYGYAAGSRPAGLEAPSLRADARGWTWLAQVEPDVYAWARLDLSRGAGWDTAAPADLRGLVPYGRCLGADVTWRVAISPAGPGFFVVGDAGAVLDPSGSHGVLRALMSGMLAAEATVGLAARRLGERAAAASYGRWLTDWFQHDVSRLHELYQIFPSWPRTRSVRGSGSLRSR